ncbi:hypothetical protein BJ912DRAFT_936710 [Pholiota molesta]|nr:hypothetical protein BJ912DRAFT_936710 [Pholiota molesta]
MLVLFEHSSEKKFNVKKAKKSHHTMTARDWLKARGVPDTEKLKQTINGEVIIMPSSQIHTTLPLEAIVRRERIKPDNILDVRELSFGEWPFKHYIRILALRTTYHKMVNHVVGLLLSTKQMVELGTYVAGKPLDDDENAFSYCRREVRRFQHRFIALDYPKGSQKPKLISQEVQTDNDGEGLAEESWRFDTENSVCGHRRYLDSNRLFYAGGPTSPGLARKVHY